MLVGRLLHRVIHIFAMTVDKFLEKSTIIVDNFVD